MKYIILLLVLLGNHSSYAQSINEPCGFSLFTNTKSKEVADFENRISKEITRKRTDNKFAFNSGIYTIPVVVHIIHNGGVENILDTQIISQIQILNEDFRKVPGTNGDGSGVDTKIQFCLAKVNPNGKCTNGIVRLKSTLTNHQTYQQNLLKELSFWPPDKYLNIYIVNSINGGILGYSSYPGGPSDADGVILRDDAFGNMGTASAPNNLGRTLTHEIAHWFGLYHTFENGCGIDTCTDGDKVCDTPPVAIPNFGCPSSINSCHNDSPDVPDQIQNYTDYTNDACKNMFTEGQRERMQATLTAIRTTIWSNANLIDTGCDTTFPQPAFCPVVADFTTSKTGLCIDSKINFTNRSLNKPTNYLWTFEGGTPSSDTSANPNVSYFALGTFAVKLKIWNATSQDSLIKTAYITVTTPASGDSLALNEGFENTSFPPSGIILENADTGVTWERTTKASYQGIASVRINNLINTNYGQSDALVLPPYNFTTYSNTPFLRFKWAYARSSPSYSDELIVLASKDCGLTWQQIFYRSGNNLTTGPTQTTEYIPDSTTVWKTANINMTAYSTTKNVQLKIINVTDGGNCLYIDNINMGDTSLVLSTKNDGESKNEITIYPNPSRSNLIIKSITSLKDCDIIIHDMLGRLSQKEILNNDYENEIHLNQSIVNGIYFIVITKKNKLFSYKIMKL